MGKIGQPHVVAGSLILVLVAVNAYLYWRNTLYQPPRVVVQLTKMMGSTWPNDQPTYEVVIYSDGTVTYKGWSHVAVPGQKVTWIRVGQLEEIIATAEQLGFFQMEDPPKNIVDELPNKVITIAQDGRSHTVRIYTYSTAELSALEAKIDQVVNSAQWVAGQ